MSKQAVGAVGAASGILLCAASAFGQVNQPDTQHPRRRIVTGTPEQQAVWKARDERCRALDVAGFTALHVGQYSEAEESAWQVLALSMGTDLLAPELLASALDAQGKDQEALQAYQTLANQGSDAPRILLPFALLLLKTGQWGRAAASYNKALPGIGKGSLLRTHGEFSLTEPRQVDLATAIHVGLALTYLGIADWGGNLQNDKALSHFQQALALAPASPLANYYFGYGLRRLGRRVEAKEAFQKAVALDGGDIKRAAEEQMKRL